MLNVYLTDWSIAIFQSNPKAHRCTSNGKI